MARFFYAFLIIFFLLPLAAKGDTPANAAAGDAAYFVAVDAAISKPDTADWKNIRVLYPQTTAFKDHTTDGPVKGLHEAGDKAAAEKTPEAVKAFKDLLRAHMGSIDSHLYALHLQSAQPLDFIDPAFEKKAASGLIQAIISTGDGQSAATAFHTLGIDEQIALLRSYYNFKITGRTKENGLDVFSVANDKSPQDAKVYFIIGAAAAAPSPLDDTALLEVRTRAAKPLPPVQDSAYLKLVDDAMAAPDKADWKNIRDLYVNTSFFRQHAGLLPEEFFADAAKKAIAAGTPAEMATYKEFLRDHFGNIASHKQALRDMAGYGDKTPDFLDRTLEQKAFDGLMQAMTAGADGLSMKTAFRTITLNEQQYVAEDFLHMKARGMGLRMENGHVYNIVKLQDDKGTTRDAYFLLDDRMTQFSLMPKVDPVPVMPPEPVPPADAAYLKLVDEALSSPILAQWAQIRQAYPDTTFYRNIGPTNISEASAEAVAEAEKDGTEISDQALAAFERDHFGALGLHYKLAGYAERTKSKNINAHYEALAFRQMLSSILLTGDGTSLATPFVLISPEEEGFFLSSFYNEKDAKPRFLKQNGVAYSVVSVKNTDTGKPMDVYFVFDKRMVQAK